MCGCQHTSEIANCLSSHKLHGAQAPNWLQLHNIHRSWNVANKFVMDKELFELSIIIAAS